MTVSHRMCVTTLYVSMQVTDLMSACARLAQLLPARRPRARPGGVRQQRPLHAAGGGRRRPLRRAPGPRVPRRPAAHRQAVRSCPLECCLPPETSGCTNEAVLDFLIPATLGHKQLTALQACSCMENGLACNASVFKRCEPHKDARGLTCAVGSHALLRTQVLHECCSAQVHSRGRGTAGRVEASAVTDVLIWPRDRQETLLGLKSLQHLCT